MKTLKKFTTVDVDMINTFTDLCHLELPVEGALEIIAPINRLGQLAEKRVGSKEAHPEQTDWTASSKEDNGQPTGLEQAPTKWVRHGVINTFGNQMIEGMPAPTEYDFFVWKGMEASLHPNGVCYHDPLRKLSTGLIEWLIFNKTVNVVATGLAYDVCVKDTLLELVQSGHFNVYVIRECTRGICPDSFPALEEELTNAGVRIYDTVDQFLAAMQ